MSSSQNIVQHFNQHDPHNRPRLIEMMRTQSNVPFVAFEEDDFYENIPPTWQPVDMFQQSFARLFAEYQENWRQNEFKQWQNSRGRNFRVLDKAAFVAKYGTPPWEFVNNILETARLDFRINAPDELDDRPYEPTLTDLSRGTKVKFNDLSSGERVLMSFALCLYYAKDHRQIVQYPQVLLFDEIDAPLHPSMTQSLLRTIEDVLVTQHKIKVILTTHSPSTVALAPEASLYAMRKVVQQRMAKTSKDSALSILMAGVPTVSISYENRRQVFVESHHDVSYYEKFYEKLKSYLNPEISINFIASGAGRIGGCAHVKEVVSQLSQAGNKTVYGIVDWDMTNSSNGQVKVLGEGQRHSIENYIFDPLLVAALLVREKIINRADVGLEENENYVDFVKMDNSRLQRAADFVIQKVIAQISTSSQSDLLISTYVGGAVIKLPKWILQIQGHEFESILKKVFPPLNAFHGEAGLKTAMLRRVVDDVPQLIPQCVLFVFKGIQGT